MPTPPGLVAGAAERATTWRNCKLIRKILPNRLYWCAARRGTKGYLSASIPVGETERSSTWFCASRSCRVCTVLDWPQDQPGAFGPCSEADELRL